MKVRFVDLLWSTGYIFKDSCPSWSGYMSSKVNDDKVLPKSYVSMLPTIDLHATDTTALYSLLSFLESQCKKLNVPMACVTFDQQLYIKAYEIVSLECICSSWRLLSTNEFCRLNWKSHGRFRIEKRFRNHIFSCHSGSHVYWKGIFTCSKRTYSLCFCGSITNLGRILEYSRSC